MRFFKNPVQVMKHTDTKVKNDVILSVQEHKKLFFMFSGWNYGSVFPVLSVDYNKRLSIINITGSKHKIKYLSFFVDEYLIKSINMTIYFYKFVFKVVPGFFLLLFVTLQIWKESISVIYYNSNNSGIIFKYLLNI